MAKHLKRRQAEVEQQTVRGNAFGNDEKQNMEALAKGLKKALEKLEKYVKKAKNNNHDFLTLAMLLSPPSYSNPMTYEHRFQGWRKYFSAKLSDADSYKIAVEYLKKAYKVYWEKYDRNNAAAVNTPATGMTSTELVFTMHSSPPRVSKDIKEKKPKLI